MEHVACDLCGADDPVPELRRDPWRLVRCRGCSLVYLDPRPGPAAMVRDFDWHNHAPLQTEARRRQESLLRRLYRSTRGKGLLRRKPRERVVLERVRAYVPRGRLLDVGCGDGEITGALAEAGYAAWGIDISRTALAEGVRERRRGLVRATLEDLPFPGAHFDVALMLSYLEHDPHPTRALQRIRETLRPGGFLFLKVPHYGSWNRRLMGAAWSGYFFPQHLYYFTPRTIARLLEKSGLELVRNGFWDHVPLSDVLWATARRPE